MGERFAHVVRRITDYPWWEVAIELLVLWLVVWAVYRFVKGTRAAGALKGAIFLLIVGALLFRLLGDQQFPRLTALYSKFITIALVALVITFQPELRRALIRLGETPFFRASRSEVKKTVEAIVTAAEFLSKNKFGAIIGVERNIGLRDAIETGQAINADISAPLLESIFWPNSPLHDMAVVVRGNQIIAAGVQFPLADPADVPDSMLGTRHRAALGMARVSDALIVVVSEETGAISVAEGTQMVRWLTPDQLRSELTRRLGRVAEKPQGEGGEAASTEESRKRRVRVSRAGREPKRA